MGYNLVRRQNNYKFIECNSPIRKCASRCCCQLTVNYSVPCKHYNMVMAAAAAASASAPEDHDLLLNRFLPYSSSQMLREQSATPGGSTLTTTNGGSNSGSTSSLVSSSSLREREKDRDSHGLSGLSRSSMEAAAAAAIYGSLSDVISLD